MDTSERYAITMPGPPGAQRPPEIVVVHATGDRTSDGIPIYADDTGTFRVEIQAGTARPLDAATGPGRHTCLHATPLL
ncbi:MULTISPECIES: DUF6296 family protein [unclassified Kitasatospora]|uniref:DUF6296 family protein n=1 Tax=unclassified Kitasatospora TaxID=2633591 RepID=UPI0033712714